MEDSYLFAKLNPGGDFYFGPAVYNQVTFRHDVHQAAFSSKQTHLKKALQMRICSQDVMWAVNVSANHRYFHGWPLYHTWHQVEMLISWLSHEQVEGHYYSKQSSQTQSESHHWMFLRTPEEISSCFWWVKFGCFLRTPADMSCVFCDIWNRLFLMEHVNVANKTAILSQTIIFCLP